MTDDKDAATSGRSTPTAASQDTDSKDSRTTDAARTSRESHVRLTPVDTDGDKVSKNSIAPRRTRTARRLP